MDVAARCRTAGTCWSGGGEEAQLAGWDRRPHVPHTLHQDRRWWPCHKAVRGFRLSGLWCPGGGCYCHHPSALGHRACSRCRCWSPPGVAVGQRWAPCLRAQCKVGLLVGSRWLGGSRLLGAALPAGPQQCSALLAGALSCRDQQQGLSEEFEADASSSVPTMIHFRNKKPNKPCGSSVPWPPARLCPGCCPCCQPLSHSAVLPLGCCFRRGARGCSPGAPAREPLRGAAQRSWEQSVSARGQPSAPQPEGEAGLRRRRFLPEGSWLPPTSSLGGEQIDRV